MNSARNTGQEMESLWTNKKRKLYHARMDEGRKRVLGIIAGILVARHLKTTEDLFDNRSSPRTEAMVASAVQWAERIMRKIDRQCSNEVPNAPAQHGSRNQVLFRFSVAGRSVEDGLALSFWARSEYLKKFCE
jgi:hypothetical protein